MTINNPQEIETSVALLDQDVKNTKELIYKLEDNVIKISEVANSVSRLLSLHDQRIEDLYQDDKGLDSKIEKTYGNLQDEMKDLHDHMRTNNRDVMDKLKSSEEAIKQELKYMRESGAMEYKNLKETQALENEKLKNDIAANNTNINNTNKRLDALERWRWVLFGGGMVLMYILSKSPISFSFLT